MSMQGVEKQRGQGGVSVQGWYERFNLAVKSKCA